MEALEGKHVRLEPLALEHHAALCEVGLDPELWRWTGGHIDTAADLRAYIERALARPDAIPFATWSVADERFVGSTRFANVDGKNRKLEIGWTWIAPPWQRTAINTEAKYLMLRHAFESMDCLRVEFKTDARNEKSRNAILRIGATQEGILRQHMVNSRGERRDSVYFSILDSEWPEIKARLEARLG